MALINCKDCGQQISDAARFCPHCGAPVVRDVYCPKCGTKVPENVKFCPNCGEVMSQTASSGGPKMKKDKVTAGIFALLLGTLGVQYFYLGKVSAGVLSIVLSLFTCGIWPVLMFIQGILMLTMTDEAFNEKYVDTDRSFPIY